MHFLLLFLFATASALEVPAVDRRDQLHWTVETRSLCAINPHYTIAITAIIQDEAPFLREWIEYHKLLGVEYFIFYNHFSSDNFLDVLSPYIARGDAEVIEWPIRQYPHESQFTAYEDAIQRMRGVAHWLIPLDIDEFIVPAKANTLHEFLAPYESYAGVSINWQIFGTSGIDHLPEGALLTEFLIRKLPPTYNNPKYPALTNRYVKVILQPERVTGTCDSPHYFAPLAGYAIVDPREVPIQAPWVVNESYPLNEAQINHYWFRTTDWFLSTKIARRKKAGDPITDKAIEKMIKLGNSETDTTIQRFIPALKQKMTE